MKFGVLISGRGSNMESLAIACEQAGWPAEIAIVISNIPGAAGLERAAAHGLPSAVVDHDSFASRDAFEKALVDKLQEYDVEAVCLAGFMRLLGPRLLRAYPQRVLNIHPSLLPAFAGLNAHDQALEYGVRWSGCTVHFVTEVMDAGPIILQDAVPVKPDDTADTLAARILEQEHRLYPKAMRLLAEGRLKLRGRIVEILATSEQS